MAQTTSSCTLPSSELLDVWCQETVVLTSTAASATGRTTGVLVPYLRCFAEKQFTSRTVTVRYSHWRFN
jgi:hypothetical protein